MDVENVIAKNINLSISFIDLDDIVFDFKDVTFKKKLDCLFQTLKDEPNIDSRLETFDEVRINN